MLYEEEVEYAKKRGKNRDEVRHYIIQASLTNFAMNEHLLLLGADQLIRDHDRMLRVRSDAVPDPDAPIPPYRSPAEMRAHKRRAKQDYNDYWNYILFSGKPIREATRLDILESVEKHRAQIRGHEAHIQKELSIANQLPNDYITVGEWLRQREEDAKTTKPKPDDKHPPGP